MTFRFLGRNGDAIRYEAAFWEAPIAPGQTGRRRVLQVDDRIVAIKKDGKVIGHRIANTSPNVSYYADLRKACRI